MIDQKLSLKSTVDSLIDGDKMILSGTIDNGEIRQDEFINVKLTPRKSRRASVSRRGYPIMNPQDKLNDAPEVDVADADASFFQKSKRVVFGLSLAAKIVIGVATLAFIWVFYVSWSRGSTIASQNKIMEAIRKDCELTTTAKEPLNKLVSEKVKVLTECHRSLEKKMAESSRNHRQTISNLESKLKSAHHAITQTENPAQLHEAYNAIRELQQLLNRHRAKANQAPLQVLPKVTAPTAEVPDQTTYLETIKKGISSAWSTIKEATSSAITKVKGVATCGGNTPTPARCSRCNDTGTFQVKVNGKERVVTCSCGDSSSLAD